jgi:hypothetical protein
MSESLNLMVRELDPLTLAAMGGSSRSGWRSDWLRDSRRSMVGQWKVLGSFVGSMRDRSAPNSQSGGWRKKRQGDSRWRDVLGNSVSELTCVNLSQKVVVGLEVLTVPIPILGGKVIRRWQAMEHLDESRRHGVSKLASSFVRHA